jgi:hypothetical protein
MKTAYDSHGKRLHVGDHITVNGMVVQIERLIPQCDGEMFVAWDEDGTEHERPANTVIYRSQ